LKGPVPAAVIVAENEVKWTSSSGNDILAVAPDSTATFFIRDDALEATFSETRVFSLGAVAPRGTLYNIPSGTVTFQGATIPVTDTTLSAPGYDTATPANTPITGGPTVTSNLGKPFMTSFSATEGSFTLAVSVMGDVTADFNYHVANVWDGQDPGTPRVKVTSTSDPLGEFVTIQEVEAVGSSEPSATNGVFRGEVPLSSDAGTQGRNSDGVWVQDGDTLTAVYLNANGDTVDTDTVPVDSQLAGREVRVLEPVKDNTLYESAKGALSNGAGQHLFAGTTNQGFLRRGLIAFDIAGTVPADSTIDAITLTLNMSKTNENAGTQTISVHRVLADWGEGSSNASGDEESGTSAAAGDATWLSHSWEEPHCWWNYCIFPPGTLWSTAGGDFAPTASGSQSVGDIGAYSWSSTQMVADVQGWLDTPTGNFGWLLKGNEAASQTAKRFDSREHPTVANRPTLTVEYTPAADPTPTPLPTPTPTATPTTAVPGPGQWGLLMMAVVVGAGLLLLGRGGARRGRRA
jgi:hypothetical protein